MGKGQAGRGVVDVDCEDELRMLDLEEDDASAEVKMELNGDGSSAFSSRSG